MRKFLIVLLSLFFTSSLFAVTYSHKKNPRKIFDKDDCMWADSVSSSTYSNNSDKLDGQHAWQIIATSTGLTPSPDLSGYLPLTVAATTYANKLDVVASTTSLQNQLNNLPATYALISSATNYAIRSDVSASTNTILTGVWTNENVRVGTATYATNADMLDGVQGASYALISSATNYLQANSSPTISGTVTLTKQLNANSGITVTGGVNVSGKIGVGNTSPMEKIDVNGNVQINTAGYQGVQIYNPTVSHGITNKAATNVTGGYFQYGNEGGVYHLGITASTATWSPLIYDAVFGSTEPTHTLAACKFGASKKAYTGNSVQALDPNETAFQFKTSTTNLLTIMGSGYTGIGTVNPSSMFEVANGSITISGVNANIVVNGLAQVKFTGYGVGITTPTTAMLGSFYIDSNYNIQIATSTSDCIGGWKAK